MKMTLYTELAVKVLVHLAAAPRRLSSIGEIAADYGISHNHLMKVVHHLGKAGFVEGVRGRAGGIRLARPASEITLGDIVRHTESGFAACEPEGGEAAGAHSFSAVVEEGDRAFVAVLDGYSVADLADAPDQRA
jgi:Rrf2 family nitric oxide-sensitive transcriptional repressor